MLAKKQSDAEVCCKYFFIAVKPKSQAEREFFLLTVVDCIFVQIAC